MALVLCTPTTSGQRLLTKRSFQHYLDAIVPRSDEDEAQDWFDGLG